MTEADPAELVARADDLDERINEAGIHDQIAHLTDYGRRNRKLIRINLALTIVVFLLALAITYLSVQVSENHRVAGEAKITAEASFAANHLTCIAGNESRAAQRSLWDYILGSPPSPAQTPEAQARVIEFRKLVTQVFADRDCDAEAPATPPTTSS